MELIPHAKSHLVKVSKLLEKLATKHFIYTPTASIYGGVSGLYDLGPFGCKLKENITSFWRNFFVEREGMLQVESTTLTPEIVLKTSGHVDKFQDMMVRDLKTNECFRADHLLELEIESLLKKDQISSTESDRLSKILSNIPGMDAKELGVTLKQFGVKFPGTGNDISDPYEFNLMFSTPIGPTGKSKGYLRPETAQGIFVNFKRLFEENGGKVPFAAAQIGTSYRNEISPRSGLLRVREFPMAEIEHFCGEDKGLKFAKIELYRNKIALFFSKERQVSGEDPVKMSIGGALEKGILTSETLGFYIGKTSEFLESIGINKEWYRFRQHLSNEMAHYACDCWDAEILTSFGWVECVGLADRACFDLTNHSKASKTELGVYIEYPQPKRFSRLSLTPNVPLIGKTFKAASKALLEKLKNCGESEIRRIQSELSKSGECVVVCEGDSVILTANMVKEIKEKVETKKGYMFTPTVVEPSFGIGRIMYALLEHSLKLRGGEGDTAKVYLSLPKITCPSVFLITPLSSKESLKRYGEKLRTELSSHGIYVSMDGSNTTIGRKYVRSDERGVMFCLTIDFDSLETDSFTVRFRDNKKQIRLSFADGVTFVRQQVKGDLRDVKIPIEGLELKE